MVPFLKNDVPTFADISADSVVTPISFDKFLHRVAAYVRKAERSFTTVSEATLPTSF